MTPPETPGSPSENPSTSNEEQPLFHNYLRVFCPFDPPADLKDEEEALLTTVHIRPGELILVHSVHANGWADGTVLTTGARGWLPTNYCETFDHPYMRNLLNAMTQFWDLLGAGEDANLSTFVRQDYIRGLIAGVRYLLEHTDCLHREAPLVQQYASIRRLRKALLADLSSLVQIAKRLQETISEPFAGEVLHVLLDELVAKAFKVVTRAVGFTDIWAQETKQKRHLPSGQSMVQVPMTPPVDGDSQISKANAAGSEDMDERIDSAKHLRNISLSEFPMPGSASGKELTLSPTAKASEKRPSMLFRPQNGMTTHRVSLLKTERPSTSSLASEQLAQAHDICISHIGALIGLRPQTRPSSEVIATTERLVKACENLMSVIEQVHSHDVQKRVSVQEPLTNFTKTLDQLIESTRDVFKSSDSPYDEVLVLPEQSRHLVDVGTSLIRCVGKCVGRTRQFIEQSGDFDLEITPMQSPSVLEDGQAISGADRPEEQRSEDQQQTGTSSEQITPTKKLPPLPPPRLQSLQCSTEASISPTKTPTEADPVSPLTPVSTVSRRSLPALPPTRPPEPPVQDNDGLKSPQSFMTDASSPLRKFSLGASVAGSTDTYHSMRDSGFTGQSAVSTRATTPDHTKEEQSPSAVMNSFSSLSSLRSEAATEASSEAETQLLQQTYASELTFNKDGQVTGGSLPALVEQLTTHDMAPDAQFLAGFLLTFRQFATPRELADALINRFEYVGESKAVGQPVRLRIYNVFKGWLETYWNAELDKDALGDIRFFALHKLKPYKRAAGERLVELTRKVSTTYQTGVISGPLVSGVGKTSTSIASKYENQDFAPEPTITKAQLAALRLANTGVSSVSVVDLDPLEVARQLTLFSSRIFCEIHSDELLSLEWATKNSTRSPNVKGMCMMNTDLAHVVGDTVLGPDDAKKRAQVIKHWSKIAHRCLELNNYESLMAIMCSLNSSVVQRLKRTWEVVSKKTKARLDELNSVVDFSRNHASLRRRLETPVAPCLPFLGVYLTDLTFVDAGNSKVRDLPGTASSTGGKVSVINFDKYMRMAKIVSHVQKFQVPYKLQEVPELQRWIQSYLRRMREGDREMLHKFHRRSLVVEPKQRHDEPKPPKLPDRRPSEPIVSVVEHERPKTSQSMKSGITGRSGDSMVMEKLDFFLRANHFAFKSTVTAPPKSPPDAVAPK